MDGTVRDTALEKNTIDRDHLDHLEGTLLSKDGSKAAVVVSTNDSLATAVKYYPDLRARVKPGPLELTATGFLAINHDFNDLLEQDLARAESVSLPLVLVLLALVFGSLARGEETALSDVDVLVEFELLLDKVTIAPGVIVRPLMIPTAGAVIVDESWDKFKEAADRDD